MLTAILRRLAHRRARKAALREIQRMGQQWDNDQRPSSFVVKRDGALPLRGPGCDPFGAEPLRVSGIARIPSAGDRHG